MILFLNKYYLWRYMNSIIIKDKLIYLPTKEAIVEVYVKNEYNDITK